MSRSRALMVLVALLLVSLFVHVAHADKGASAEAGTDDASEATTQPVDQFHVVALFDVAATGAGYSSGHGAVDVGWERSGLRHGARIYAGINTETLELYYADHALSNRLSFGVGLKGELLYAGLLPDYIVAGELVPERGFLASYVQAAFELKARVANAHFVAMNTAIARNVFTRRGSTADELVLPADHWSFVPQISYTYWAPGDDSSNWERHRLHPRTSGIAFGGTLGLRVRSDTRRWGTIAGGVEAEGAQGNALRENNPSVVSPNASFWLRAGSDAEGVRFRAQGSLRAGVTSGADDVSRARVGGMNPYSAPIPGVAWAGFVVDHYVQADLEGRFVLGARHELGMLVSLGAVADPLRSGEPSEWAAIPSLGLVADLRPGAGAWQVDLRVAIASARGWGAEPIAFGGYVAVGRTF